MSESNGLAVLPDDRRECACQPNFESLVQRGKAIAAWINSPTRSISISIQKGQIKREP